MCRWCAKPPPIPYPYIEPPPRLSVARDSRDVRYLDRKPASTLFTCATSPLREVRGTDPALRVLVAALGQGASSRLGDQLRELNGLTYVADARIIRRRHAIELGDGTPHLEKEAAEIQRVTPAELARESDLQDGAVSLGRLRRSGRRGAGVRGARLRQAGGAVARVIRAPGIRRRISIAIAREQ